MIDDSQTQIFPDGVYTDQAEYLAQHTSLTESEAEAYLRRKHIPDEKNQRVLDRTLATQMGVSPSTYSIHLGNARDKLEEETALQNALSTLLLTTDIGGVDGHNRQVIGSTHTKNMFVLIMETAFYDENDYDFASKYKAHLVYRESEPDIDFDDMPDVIHYDKHSIFTIEASQKHHFVDSVAAYIDSLSALEAYDLVSTIRFLEEIGFPETGDVTTATLQDAVDTIKQ